MPYVVMSFGEKSDPLGILAAAVEAVSDGCGLLVEDAEAPLSWRVHQQVIDPDQVDAEAMRFLEKYGEPAPEGSPVLDPQIEVRDDLDGLPGTDLATTANIVSSGDALGHVIELTEPGPARDDDRRPSSGATPGDVALDGAARATWPRPAQNGSGKETKHPETQSLETQQAAQAPAPGVAPKKVEELQRKIWSALDDKSGIATSYFAQELVRRDVDVATEQWAQMPQLVMLERFDAAALENSRAMWRLDAATKRLLHAGLDVERRRADLKSATRVVDETDKDDTAGRALALEKLTAARIKVEEASRVHRLAEYRLSQFSAAWSAQERTLEMYEELVRHMGGLPSPDESAQAGIYTRLLKKRLKLVDELVASLTAWRRLAYSAAVVLLLVLVFASSLLWVLRSKVADLSGFELTGVIVALAVFVISPAVLLLLERPLKQLDEGASAKAEGDSSDSAGSDKDKEEQAVASSGGAATPADTGESSRTNRTGSLTSSH
jgi:hypothetical protein